MFVNHLLLAICHQHHHKAVKACDDPPELETVHQEQGDGNLVPFNLLQNGVLERDCFCHMYTFFLVWAAKEVRCRNGIHILADFSCQIPEKPVGPEPIFDGYSFPGFG